MTFLVDGMLGGLAKWLRLLGQEVEYEPDTKDNDLLQAAQAGNMVLLTRDEELHKRAIAKGITSALVLGETEEERLAQVSKTFKIRLEIDMARTKCPECGSDLSEVGKEDVSGEVPSTSLRLYDKFWRCNLESCRKVYWIGSHWKRINQTFEEARKIESSYERRS